MKKFGISFAILMAVFGAFAAKEAQACGQMGCGYYYNQGFTGVNVNVGFSGALPPPMVQPVPMGGPVVGTHGVAPGAFGVMRPAWYGPIGRYPKLGFATPLRPWGGFTPVRQFLFGRGAIRRQTRRAFLFGRRGCC